MSLQPEIDINKEMFPPKRKEWQKYFFEFLMVFLGVTLGFLVDNLREEISERNLETEHIQSLFSDLKQDTIMFQKQMKALEEVVNMCDSVVIYLRNPTMNAHDRQRIYFLSRRLMPRVSPHFVNDRAFEEMRSSGALRLIHHKNIADSISKYYFSTKELLWLNDLVLDRSQRKTDVESQLLSAFIIDDMVNKKTLEFSPPQGNADLITNNKELINQFALSIHYITAVCIYKKNYLRILENNSKRLLRTLQNEYPNLTKLKN